MEVVVIINGVDKFLINLPTGFYGILQLQIANEDMLMIRKEETIKPDQARIAS